MRPILCVYVRLPTNTEELAVHRELAKEYGMIGMVVHPAIQSQSLAIFIRGDHDVGTFIELLGHHQIETGK